MPKGLERYGLRWPEPEAGVDPSASIELAMSFHRPYFAASGFLGRFEHLRNAIDLIWNIPRREHAAKHGFHYDPRKHDAYIWNEWTEEMQRLFCEYAHRVITGPNASWKTTSAAIYHLCAWYASPSDTIVVLTSTTLPGLRKRIWKEILRYHRLANTGFGNLNASDYAIRFNKGSDEAGIFGIATGQDEGDVEKAVEKIIGFHAKNTYSVVDEMQATNEAIVKASVSLEAGAEINESTGLGNADSELDTHGQACEPVDGWDSITPESDFWLTKRGACLHLDGLRSPRIVDDKDCYPGLLTQADIDSTIRDYGEDSPEFWRGRRGFWAPQGVQRTVLSTAMITKGKAREKAIWVGDYTTIAALDPSFEGKDRCVLRFFYCGVIDGGATVLALKEIILIKVQVSSPEPVHFQIVRMAKEECIKRNVPPERFGTDSTGEGGGLASIFQREWGPIHLFEFGGRPSTDPVSETNPKRSDQEYDRKVTELHFFFRTLVMKEQIRELDLETATEFCQRRYEMKGNLIAIETKTLMKQRTRRSPDLSDNAVIGAALAKKLGLLGSAAQTAYGQRSAQNWREFAKKHDVESNYLVA